MDAPAGVGCCRNLFCPSHISFLHSFTIDPLFLLLLCCWVGGCAGYGSWLSWGRVMPRVTRC